MFWVQIRTWFISTEPNAVLAHPKPFTRANVFAFRSEPQDYFPVLGDWSESENQLQRCSIHETEHGHPEWKCVKMSFFLWNRKYIQGPVKRELERKQSTHLWCVGRATTRKVRLQNPGHPTCLDMPRCKQTSEAVELFRSYHNIQNEKGVDSWVRCMAWVRWCMSHAAYINVVAAMQPPFL